MEKHSYVGKTKEEAIEKATIDLQELKENLIITVKEEKKSLLNKKVEIEVIEKRDLRTFIKSELQDLLYTMGYKVEIEMQMKEEMPIYRIYSNNDALLIGKNGKNLETLSYVLKQIVYNQIGAKYSFILDVSDYREKNDQHIAALAKKIARDVARTKVEVKMDSMNSYQRRIVHQTLSNNKYVYTKSEGEDPNRCVVVKPREE